MKKNRILSLVLALVMLLILLPVMALATDGVAIHSRNFPDANFRNFVEQYDTENGGDGILSASELAAVEAMDCSDENIADLKGIEHFTALRRLECYDNKLTSLDVSRNTALMYLDCSRNQLTRLDLSRNTAMPRLICQDNKLTSLDVSRNTELKALNCIRNQLTSLDVSRNTALTGLYCYGNQLTSLDVCNIPAIRDAVVNGIKNSSNANYDIYKSELGNVTVDKTVKIVSSTVTIDQSSPYPGDTLTVTLGGAVASYPTSQLSYQWSYSNDNGLIWYNIAGATSPTYTVPGSQSGKYIRLRITKNSTGAFVISNSVYIAKLPDFGGSVYINQRYPSVGMTLTASLSGAVLSYPDSLLSYQWQYSTNGSQFFNIDGATNTTYKVPESQQGRYIRLRITDNLSGKSIYSDSVKILPAFGGSARIDQTNPRPGDTLTATLSGAIASYPSNALDYQWQFSSDGGRTFFDLSGANGTSYKTDSTDNGLYYRLCIRAKANWFNVIYSNSVLIAEASAYQKGDVDRNGSVSNSDLILVARHVVNLITLTGEQFTLGDMNDDGVITNTDIITLARKIVGLT